MQDAQNLLRKSAIEKLSSPEQLDVMMQVTSPAAWLALAGVGILLVFVTVWSVVGQTGIQVEGKGILMRGAAVLDVTTPAQGKLAEVLVKSGDTLKEGQVVARLDQAELKLRIENARAQMAQIEAQKSDLGSAGRSIVAQYRAQLVELREKAATQEKLVTRGLLTRATLFRTREQIASTEQMIAQSEQTQSGKTIQVDDLKRQISELEARRAGSTDVKSPYAGRVLEITTAAGGLVGPGARILTLEPLDAPLSAVIYVPATEGKKVRPAMDVRVSPSTVKAEEYGFMVGNVLSVGNFPVTPEALRQVLRNDRLVDELTGKSASIELIVQLLPDKNTPSGFKWSSSSGPPTQVYSGTIATGSVVVENRKPISYVLPVVKKSLGV
jgi:HlyD family secretion protein